LASTGPLSVSVWDRRSGRLAFRVPWGKASTSLEQILVRTDRVPLCVAFSPDSLRLAAGGSSGPAAGEVQIWDTATARRVDILSGHAGPVVSLAFDSAGRLVSGSHDKTARVWEETTGKEVHRFEGHGNRVNAAASHPIDARIASGGREGTVQIWDGATGKAIRKLTGHSGAITGLAFSRDGRRLVSSSAPRDPKQNGEVIVWDATTWKRLFTFLRHSHGILDVAFSPCSRLVASGGDDRVVRVWEAVTGRELFVLRGHHHTVWRVAFSPDGRHVASSSEDRTVRVWDVTERGNKPGGGKEPE
jgi:WD40 repeat protein